MNSPNARKRTNPTMMIAVLIGGISMFFILNAVIGSYVALIVSALFINASLISDM